MKHLYCIAFVFVSSFGSFFTRADTLGSALQTVPVQYGGRVQPLDTFARSGLHFIYGQERFNDKSAIDILMSWILLPDYWREISFVRVDYSPLKIVLGLNEKNNLFSPKELLENKIFLEELNELQIRLQSKEDLDLYFKAVQKLGNQLLFYQAFQNTRIPGLVPRATNDKKLWASLYELAPDSPARKRFQDIVSAYVEAVFAQENQTKDQEQKKEALKESVLNFQTLMNSINPAYAKDLRRGFIELHYNQLNPFHFAWIFYLLGLLLLAFRFLFLKRVLFYTGVGICLLALASHTYGMILRSLIMERPPVTNMYETVIWVPWVSVLLGLLLWWKQKFFASFVCACVVAFFCLFLADFTPALLDGRLSPLEAVLRSNFWLATHVLIITMSYAAFFLAFAIGDVALFFFLCRDEEKNREKIQKCVKAIDRLIQVGVVFLAAGTVLGGIWADYSWGRFWGWDPKETWALISLLGYVSLLHGRLLAWVKDFGMVVGSVLIFFLVVMAWYGVNYVLGQGLHSYGFGSGGVEFVAGFAFLHLLYVLIVWSAKNK